MTNAFFYLSLLCLGLPPAVYGQAPSIDTPLTFSQSKEYEITAGQPHNFDLQLEAGQFLKLEIRFKGFSGKLAVYDPDNRTLKEVSGSGSSLLPKHVALIIPASGKYRIEVRSAEKTATAGRYRMLIGEPRAASEADRHYSTAQQAFDHAEELFAKATAESRREAVARFQELLPSWRAAGDKRREAETQHSVATIFKMLGDNRQALTNEQEALALARSSGDRQLEASALNGLGSIHSSLSDYRQALDSFQQARQLTGELGDREGEVDILNNLGALSAATGASRQALDYYQQALAIAREIGYRRIQARLLQNIAVRHLDAGEPNRASERLEESLAISRELNLRDDEAIALHNLSGAWFQLSEYQKALDSDTQALALARAAGYVRIEVGAHVLLGQIQQRLGDEASATEHFKQALALCRKAGYRNEEAIALLNLGAAYQRLGQSPQALENIKQATAIHRALGARGALLSDLSHLGVVHLAREETDQAAESFSETLALSRELGVPRFEVTALLNLGRIYRLRGEREQAAESLRTAIDMSRTINYAYLESEALHELARLTLDQKNFHQAQTHIEQAITLFESSRGTIGSQDLRASFRGKSQNYYETLIETLMRRHEQDSTNGFAALAFQASEQSRARSLVELLSEARADIRQGIAPELTERERELRKMLAAKSERLARMRTSDLTGEPAIQLKREIGELIARHDEAQTRIRLSNPRYAALMTPEPARLSDIQKRTLNSNTLLLEYSLGEERSYLFAVTPTALHSFTLPGRKEIETKARLLYSLLTERGKPGVFRSAEENRQWMKRNEQESMAAAMDLSRMLLGPVAGLLAKKRLMIVADGILHYIPFAALPEPETKRQRGTASKRIGNRQTEIPDPLVVNHEIVALPSASVLELLRSEEARSNQARKTIAVLADPVFEENDGRIGAKPTVESAAAREVEPDDKARSDKSATNNKSDSASPYARLPFTRLEAEGIVRLVPESERRVAMGFDASRLLATSQELEQYRYLHFATHGVLDSTHPELSGLVFSLYDERGRRQNGFLRGMDVYNLRLPAELVVLSGCQTALGKEVNGEGLLGLTRGFMYAGAKRVMAGLWKVNDAATAELMQRFYKRMLAGEHLNPAAALRAAQISMWREPRWRSPFYWAAFVLQGEW